MNYYNDNDPFVAQWLRKLIELGYVGQGKVDERSILEVKPEELNGYTRCHFFAGVAGWQLALQLTDWPADRPVWTGSCPCQPFSAAGKRKGGCDDRNLWPAWFELIRVCRPPVIFGEQVEAAIGFGWLDRVFDDLEAEGYTAWACVLPACSVGAPTLGSRLYWMGATNIRGLAENCEIYKRSNVEMQFWQHGTFYPVPGGSHVRRIPASGSICVDNGVSETMERLLAGACGVYGNAVVPQVAAAFIKAFMGFGSAPCR